MGLEQGPKSRKQMDGVLTAFVDSFCCLVCFWFVLSQLSVVRTGVQSFHIEQRSLIRVAMTTELCMLRRTGMIHYGHSHPGLTLDRFW